jgi:hypothetical protein
MGLKPGNSYFVTEKALLWNRVGGDDGMPRCTQFGNPIATRVTTRCTRHDSKPHDESKMPGSGLGNKSNAFLSCNRRDVQAQSVERLKSASVAVTARVELQSEIRRGDVSIVDQRKGP